MIVIRCGRCGEETETIHDFKNSYGEQLTLEPCQSCLDSVDYNSPEGKLLRAIFGIHKNGGLTSI